MSVNQRSAIDETRTRNYGKIYNSIDFEINPDLHEHQYRENPTSTVVGTFLIGNKEFPVTFTELSKIIETANDAQDSVNKSYRFGLLK